MSHGNGTIHTLAEIHNRAADFCAESFCWAIWRLPSVSRCCEKKRSCFPVAPGGSFLLALSLWLCQFLLVVLLSSPVSSISGSRQKPSETMKIKMPRMRLVYTVIEQKY